MANTFSALKRARQTPKRTAVNRANTSQMRSSLRKLRESIAAGDKKAATAQYSITVSTLDKAVKKGSLHKNAAARHKSRLAAQLAKMK